MNRSRSIRVEVILAMSVLWAGAAQAMEIVRFDKMAASDQGDYVVMLIEGAQKVLIEQDQQELAARVHTLFTYVPPGDDMPMGMTEFEINLAKARVADLERIAKNPEAARLEVEHAMFVTLRKNGIVLPKGFIHVMDGFQPKQSLQ